MATSNKYAVPLETLMSVVVPADEQVEQHDVHVVREYLTPQELDRARLLSTTEAGRLHPR